MIIDIPSLWQAAAIILGLQTTTFSWRIQREVDVSESGDITWLPPADYLNLASMLFCVSSVFALPAIGIASANFAKMSFGLVAILFVGHSFALAAHYELFTRGRRSHQYFPLQEKIAMLTIAIIGIAYTIWWGFAAIPHR